MQHSSVRTALCLACLLQSACNDTGARTTFTNPNQRTPGSDSRTRFVPGDPFRESSRRTGGERTGGERTGGESRADSLAADESPPQPNVPVPEPGTLLLVGTGLMGLAYLRHRRNETAGKSG